jgi:hypothetical protein
MTIDQAERPRSYSLREAAGVLGVSVTALRRRVAAGQIKAERVERPQGSVWRVYLDAHAPGQAPRVTVSERDTLKAPRDRPQLSAGDLVSLVRELSEKLAESAAVAAMWQERARVLGEQLALAAPAENPVAGQQVPAVPLTTRLRALAPWALLLAIMLVVVLLGWPG